MKAGRWMQTVILLALPVMALLFTVVVVGALAVIGAEPIAASASPEGRTYADTRPVIVTAAPIAYFDQPIAAALCSVIAADINVLVRSAPADAFAPFGVLEQGASLQALGRTTTEPVWYAVGYAERRAWIAAGPGALFGDCAGLPVVANPLVPDAPLDAPAALVEVDRDGTARYREVISTPGGDIDDVVWVRVINLYSQPPNNFREFTLTVNCGASANSAPLQWGLAGGTMLDCGDSLTFPFVYGASDRPLIIGFAPGSPQSYVEYELTVERLEQAVG